MIALFTSKALPAWGPVLLTLLTSSCSPFIQATVPTRIASTLFQACSYHRAFALAVPSARNILSAHLLIGAPSSPSHLRSYRSPTPPQHIIWFFLHYLQPWSVTTSYLTLCDSMDCNLPGSSVHGVLQARILEWVVMPSSRGSSPPRDWTHSLLHFRWILYPLRHFGSPFLHYTYH